MATATKTRKTRKETGRLVINNGTEIRDIRAADLMVDEDYQRVSLGSVRAKNISRCLRRKDIHTLLVSPREQGKFACLDGGHRLHAIALKYPGFQDKEGRTVWIRCEIEPKSRKVKGNFVDEAKSFLGAQNFQRPVNTNDAFKARRYAQEVAAIKTFDIAKVNGITIKFRRSDERFSVGANETKNGGVFYWAYGLLSESKYRFFCNVLNEFINDDGDIQVKALQSTFLRGLAHFIKTTDMKKRDILVAARICDSASDIAERAWSKSRSGFQRPKIVSDEIERALLRGLHVAA